MTVFLTGYMEYEVNDWDAVFNSFRLTKEDQRKAGILSVLFWSYGLVK